MAWRKNLTKIFTCHLSPHAQTGPYRCMIYANENLRAKREPFYSPMLAEKKLEHIEISNYRDFYRTGRRAEREAPNERYFLYKKTSNKDHKPNIPLYFSSRDFIFDINDCTTSEPESFGVSAI